MSTWFIKNADGTRSKLPPCSADYQPSRWWYDSCLHDPICEICRAHRQFFLSRKVANVSRT